MNKIRLAINQLYHVITELVPVARVDFHNSGGRSMAPVFFTLVIVKVFRSLSLSLSGLAAFSSNIDTKH